MTKLILNYEAKFIPPTKSLWGEAYFEISKDNFFPHERWTDMSLPFARAILGSLKNIEKYKSIEKEVYFYDGPYEIKITKCAEEKNSNIFFVARDTVVSSAKIDYLLFSQETKKCVFEFMRSIKNRNMPDHSHSLAIRTF